MRGGMCSASSAKATCSAGSHRAWWLRLFDERAVLLEDVATARDLTARDVMTTPAVTVAEETPVDVLASLMRRRRVKRLPVLRAGQLTGLVSRADLLDALVRQVRPAPDPG
jgi:CBS domain-containing protein